MYWRDGPELRQEMDAASNVAHGDNTGEAITVFDHTRDLVHEVIAFWEWFKGGEPLNICEVPWERNCAC